MISELGQLSLTLALLMAGLLAIFPLWGAQRNIVRWMQLGRPLALGLWLFTLIAYGCLTYGFVHNDFTLRYVAEHSNSLLPWYYRVTAVWGGHEGSFLLWVTIFSSWSGAVALFSRRMPLPMLARVLAILGMVALSFYLFILLASNPFERLLPYYPVDGQDLNPLLQDVGMIIHPPMLYMGYVGFSVAFAFALAALISGKLDSAWARWSRPWTLAAWVFLTIGIALGSWWAYSELGWGGWWFWDPVENASFMPWLVGTALLHSLAVTEKRKVFRAWTVLLAIAAFSLSLVGTFLVRSGVLISVHSFANDPARGLFILGILVVTIGGSLTLFGVRAAELRSFGQYHTSSREVMLMGNNVLLCAATLVVLLGTLFPLVHKELGMGTISIGAPFFNQMFSFLIVPFVLLLGVGPLSRWKRQPLGRLQKPLLLALLVSVMSGTLIVYQFDQLSWLAILGASLSIWIVLTSLLQVRQRVSNAPRPFYALLALGRSHWAMVIAHIGFAVTLMGIAITSQYSVEKDVRMAVGEQTTLAGYQFVFNGVSNLTGPNYSGYAAAVRVMANHGDQVTLQAQKRFYPVQGSMMTEAAVDRTLWRDVYVALGEQFKDGQWGLRLYVKPLVSWIWLGALIMAAGGMLAWSDRRYRLNRRDASLPPMASLEGGQ